LKGEITSWFASGPPEHALHDSSGQHALPIQHEHMCAAAVCPCGYDTFLLRWQTSCSLQNDCVDFTLRPAAAVHCVTFGLQVAGGASGGSALHDHRRHFPSDLRVGGIIHPEAARAFGIAPSCAV